MKPFPRVLIITKSKIGDIDSAGAALRNWFKEWPRDHLAQIYSGVPAGEGEFCGRSFCLGPEERRLGKIFFKLKRTRLADAAMPYRAGLDGRGRAQGAGWLDQASRGAGRVLVESGLWELLFPPRLSPRLRSWIEEFRPEVLFAQGCDITFMRIPLLIKAAYGTPIHFDVVDDWVEHLHRASFAGGRVNGVVQRAFRELVNASSRRHTIGEAMAEEYQARYGVPFGALMQCDDSERFSNAAPLRERGPGEVEIVYSGSLALNRWEALLDLTRACESLRATGLVAGVTAYVPFVPKEAADGLRGVPHLTLKSAVPDAEVPRVLTGADVLFLPESFEERISEYVRLSISTKAHLYMMSGRPSLVYGPAGIGTVEYARRHGWGHVVDRPGPRQLAGAVRLLVSDERYREEIVARAKRVAETNHLGARVRESLRQALLSSCN